MVFLEENVKLKKIAHNRFLAQPYEHNLPPIEFVKQYFIDAGYGGGYGSYDPARLREDRTLYKGSVWQVGYQVCSMYVKAL